jgi:hypothetical protein
MHWILDVHPMVSQLTKVPPLNVMCRYTFWLMLQLCISPKTA